MLRIQQRDECNMAEGQLTSADKLRRVAQQQRERDIRVRRRNATAWLSDTVQVIDDEWAIDFEVTTPEKNEAYDGRIFVLNVEKRDFLQRRELWVQETPSRDKQNVFDYHVTRDYERRPDGR